jgi:chorismate-pyruvate lyase
MAPKLIPLSSLARLNYSALLSTRQPLGRHLRCWRLRMRELKGLQGDSGGRIAFRDEFTDLVERLKITPYTKLYEMHDGA